MSPAPRFSPPEIDKQTLMRLRRKDCNKAQVYVVWTRIFLQDCQVTTIHDYLLANYEWAPRDYGTMRKWMRDIQSAQHPESD